MQPQQEQIPKLRLLAVSPAQIYHDYQYLLKATGVKQEKRLARFRFLCDLLGYNPHQFLDTITLPPSSAGLIIQPDDVARFFAAGPDSDVCYEPFVFRGPGSDVDVEIKRAVCAELTQRLNATDLVYNISCGYASRLVAYLKKSPIFAELFEQGEIIFMLKGSMAQKRVLAAAHPDRRGDVEAIFGNGGDNDCNLLINPKRSDFAAIYRLASDAVQTFLLQEAPRISRGMVSVEAKTVAGIQVAGVPLAVRPHVRQNFHIRSDASGISWCDLQVVRQDVYVSRNDTLDFLDELQNRAKFVLHRLKYAFEVRLGSHYRIFGAEILDIAIPDQDEYRIKIEFEQYRSGKWLTEIEI